MRAKYVGNKADRIINAVKNADVAVIPRGSPVVLNIVAGTPGVDDGLGVVLPSTAGAGNTLNLHYGITTTAIDLADYGETVVSGIANGLVQKQSRAATTASWPSVASVAKGIVKIDPVNNIFIAGVASDGLLYTLLDDAPALAGSASNSGDTRLTITVGARIFVRAM